MVPIEDDPAAQARVRRAVNRALLPPLFLVAFACLLDRSNLAFASLQASVALGQSRGSSVQEATVGRRERRAGQCS